MPYPAIDPRRLQVFPLAQRRNLLRMADELKKTMAGHATVHSRERVLQAKIDARFALHHFHSEGPAMSASHHDPIGRTR